jgi:hypothetical protein
MVVHDIKYCVTSYDYTGMLTNNIHASVVLEATLKLVKKPSSQIQSIMKIYGSVLQQQMKRSQTSQITLGCPLTSVAVVLNEPEAFQLSQSHQGRDNMNKTKMRILR